MGLLFKENYIPPCNGSVSRKKKNFKTDFRISAAITSSNFFWNIFGKSSSLGCYKYTEYNTAQPIDSCICLRVARPFESFYFFKDMISFKPNFLSLPPHRKDGFYSTEILLSSKSEEEEERIWSQK